MVTGTVRHLHASASLPVSLTDLTFTQGGIRRTPRPVPIIKGYPINASSRPQILESLTYKLMSCSVFWVLEKEICSVCCCFFHMNLKSTEPKLLQTSTSQTVPMQPARLISQQSAKTPSVLSKFRWDLAGRSLTES